MTLDQQQFCPCGSGKKIKFCCKDIAKTLDKISRAVEGQQYESAIQQLDRANEEYPQRAALWAIKITVLLQTGRFDEAAKALSEFLAFAPENPIALAASAVMKITTMSPPVEGDDPDVIAAVQNNIVADATATLHRALAHSPSQMPVQVYEAIGLVGRFLIETGHVLAGREHLLFQYAVSPDQAEGASQLLVETGRSREVPLLLKQELSLPAPADWVQWKADYAVARELGLRGAWTPAAEKIRSLIDANEPHPVLLQAYATLCCRLPDDEGAAEALRAVVDCPDVALDDAVEAEALALLFDSDANEEKVDLVHARIPLKDAEAALEKMQADRRAELLRMDFSNMGQDGSPPPKSGFTILDRPMPVSGAELTAEAIPHAFCESLLFGKQTDRNARLEFYCTRRQLNEMKPILDEILGDEIAGECEETVVQQVPSNLDKMTVKPMFPRETPRDFQVLYVRDIERRQLLDVWPNLPQTRLDGKTAKEAAADPAYQRRLLGAILNLHVRRGAMVDAAEFTALRKSLNLPEPATLIPTSEEARRIPLVRFERIDVSALATEDLTVCFARALQNGMSNEVTAFGSELVSRDTVDGGINKGEIYGRMAQYATDPQHGIELLEKAQTEAVAAGESPAAWMVSELTYRIVAGQQAQAQALMNTIQTKHINEPGVAQMLFQTLQQLGIIGPDGQPRQAATPGDPAAAASIPGATAPTPAATQGGVWTPDGSSPAQPTPSNAGGQEGKSAIWTPGMD